MCGNAPKQWSTWLPLAEWWFNTTFHTTLNNSPYHVVYGVEPYQLLIPPTGSTNLTSVEELLKGKEEQLEVLSRLT